MFAKLAALTVTLVLLGATMAVAAPPASDNLDDSVELTLSATEVPLYYPTIDWLGTIQDIEPGDNAEF